MPRRRRGKDEAICEKSYIDTPSAEQFPSKWYKEILNHLKEIHTSKSPPRRREAMAKRGQEETLLTG
jgi:hypothetical protein